ncbi:MAG: ATP-binding cassette domain-containing protein, partial [Defluviitaleaceae bacterium]|nr:ATP-binding cassette domain-containing protein [Defluviitaleaceae bacterium]
EIRRRVDEALQAVGMSDFRESAPHHLSGGQKQRIAIAGILAMRPNIILLDEPTAMLDPIGRKEVISTVRRLNRDEGITVVLITHYMDEAAQADRVIVMDEGKISMQGSPKEVFSDIDALKAIGLDVPQTTEIAHRLRLRGCELDEGILSVEELVDALCQLK